MVFGTTDIAKIAKRIVSEGEVQLTTQQRHGIADKKRK